MERDPDCVMSTYLSQTKLVLPSLSLQVVLKQVVVQRVDPPAVAGVHVVRLQVWPDTDRIGLTLVCSTVVILVICSLPHCIYFNM